MTKKPSKNFNLGMSVVKVHNEGRLVMGGTAHERLINSYLEKIQQELSPEQAKMVIAINTDTGEYALGEDSREALHAYRERWGDYGFYLCRVDGSPSGRM
jgi:hypothetical protein